MKKNHIPASYLLLRKNTKILLLKRFNTGFQDGNYSLVSGHVEGNESFSQCIIREAQEEAGIFLKKENLKMVHMQHRNSGEKINNERIDMFFVATKWTGDITNTEPHKCDDLSWFELEELPKNIIPYIKQVLKHVENEIHYSERGWE